MAMNRPEYRDAKTPRAVTVYTIAQESRHVIFKNIPALSGEETIIQDLLNRCGLYGTVENWRQLDNNQKQHHQQPSQESFTLPALLVTFATIDQARWVKRRMDDQVFYANLLQVYYAPEYETVEDMRIKMEDRRAKVYARLQNMTWDDMDENNSGDGANKNKSRKRKRINDYKHNRPQQQQYQRQDDGDGQQQQQQQQQQLAGLPLSSMKQQKTRRSTVTQGMKGGLLPLEPVDDGTAAQKTTMETPIDGTIPYGLDQASNTPPVILKPASASASASSTTAKKRRRI